MSRDEQRESLAEQAAAWVPPWERRPTPAAAAAPPEAAESDPEPVASAGPAESEPEQVGSPEPAVAGPEPVGSAEPAVTGPEPVEISLEQALAEPAPAEPAPAEPEPAVLAPADPASDVARARAAEPAPAPALTDEAELRAALEAILLVVDEPVAEVVLAQVVEQPTERVGALLRGLASEYADQGRGFELRRAAGGWRLYTRPEYAAYVERFVLGGQSVRLTQAALETLAVIAYKQPVTRSRISAIRGVNCDGVVRTLVTRGLIEECGTEPETGAFLYRTTTLFLEKLGLNSVDELPPLAPFLPEDVEEIADAER